MNPNWLGIISVILAFGAFIAVYRLAKPQPLKRRLLVFAASLMAALPGLSFTLYYLHLVAPADWYFEFRSIRGTELLIIFIGVLNGAFATLLPRRYLVLPLLGVAAFSITPFIKPFIGPIEAATFRNQWDNLVCMQSTRSTCGAASAASILKQLGVDATEAEIAKDAHSYSGGTEAWYLARAIRRRGFEVGFRSGKGFHPEYGLPAIVGVRLGVIGHFIPILNQNGDQFTIGDPMRGHEVLSREELEQRYEFTGFHMKIMNRSEREQP